MRLSTLLLGTALLSIPVLHGSLAIGQARQEEPGEPQLSPAVVEFVETYCSECHNDFVTEGDRSFDPFLTDPNGEKHHLTVEEMLDQLNLGKMPKKAKDVPQPSLDERRAATAAMTEYLSLVLATEKPVETPLRRLTRVEYSNSLRDLFGYDPAISAAIASFPPDANAHGFTNLGHAQTLSEAQLGAYVRAAEEVAEFLFARHDEALPAPVRRVYRPDDIGVVTDAVTDTPFGAENGPDAHLSPHALAFKSADHAVLDIGGGRVDGQRPYYPRDLFKNGGVPADGTYTIRVKAEALNRFHGFDPGKIGFDPAAQSLKLAIGVAASNRQFEVVQALERRHVKFIDLPDNGAQEFAITLQLNKGNVPFIFWPNGPDNSHTILFRIMQNYHPEELPRHLNDKGTILTMPTWAVSPSLLDFLRKDYKGPLVRFHFMEVDGPYPVEREAVFDREAFAALVDRPVGQLDQTLSEFATKVFRRPVTSADIAPFTAYTRANLKAGMGKREALKQGIIAILSSPNFLYLVEGNAEEGDRLDQFELASRLSYFLWSSIPDEALLADAANGQLSDEAVLEGHVRRMVRDKKAGAFVSGFLNSWLRLDKLGSMPPDSGIYRSYYKNRLETAMRRETELLFGEVLHGNQPPSRFLDADFSFINDALASHYGIEGQFGEEFRKVPLTKLPYRKGVTGHASILTASANGVETSPVLRGVWVLENLLGTPPSPPPPDVPAIEPDTRGATTVRELLERHRSDQACADCHAYIDPYGFPLETFGPVGEARTRYPQVVDGKTRLDRGILIDSTTELASGERIENLGDFHKVVLDNRHSFHLNLLSRLLTYGTGREPTFRDRPEIEALVDGIEQEDKGFLDMVSAAVTSEFFSRR